MPKFVAIVWEKPMASTALLTARLASRMTHGSIAAISAAKLMVRSRKVSRGTTSLRMPHSRACSAVRDDAVERIS
jgi:hypothetical protein